MNAIMADMLVVPLPPSRIFKTETLINLPAFPAALPKTEDAPRTVSALGVSAPPATTSGASGTGQSVMTRRVSGYCSTVTPRFRYITSKISVALHKF